MENKRVPLVAALLAALMVTGGLLVGPSVLAADAPAVQVKIGWYSKLVTVDFVKQQAALPKMDGVLLIDSRPKERKYDLGHIPTAISLPDSQFDKLATTLLPPDKATLLVFYCDGPECMLSHNSAFKAEKLGYTNIRVYADGFPDWIKHGQLHAVSVAHLKKLIDEKVALTLVDSRPKERKYDLGQRDGGSAWSAQ